MGNSRNGLFTMENPITWMIRGNPRLRKLHLHSLQNFQVRNFPIYSIYSRFAVTATVTRLIADYPPNYGHIWRSTSTYLTRLRSGHITSTCNLTIMEPHPIFRVRSVFYQKGASKTTRKNSVDGLNGASHSETAVTL